MNIDQQQLEQNESEPVGLVVDFVRHEKPEYKGEEFASGNLEGELSPASLVAARAHAEGLAATIDKDNELVVFWVSPKRRARQTYSVYQNVFREQGVHMYESGFDRMFNESLRDVKTSGGDIAALSEGMKAAGVDWGAWMEYWSETAALPPTTETPEELARRSARVITYLERIARTIAPNTTKRLHFICIGHEEGVRDLLEAALGQGTKKGTGPAYGERIHAEIVPSVREQVSDEYALAKINVSFRETKGTVAFDPRSRVFVR